MSCLTKRLPSDLSSATPRPQHGPLGCQTHSERSVDGRFGQGGGSHSPRSEVLRASQERWPSPGRKHSGRRRICTAIIEPHSPE